MENMRENSNMQDNGGMEELSAYIEVMKIKKAVFGGFDKVDVYQKMQGIGERYQHILSHKLAEQKESTEAELVDLKEEIKDLYEQKLREEKLIESKNKEIELLTDQLQSLDSGSDQSARANEKIRDLQNQLRRSQNQLRRYKEELDSLHQSEPKEYAGKEDQLEEAMAILREARMEAEQIKKEAFDEAEKESLRMQAMVRQRMEGMEENIRVMESRAKELDLQVQDKTQRLQKLIRGFDELRTLLLEDDPADGYQQMPGRNSDFSVISKLRAE